MTRSTASNGSKAARAIAVQAASPMIPYVVWKFPRALAAALDEAAEERGATRAGLVRKVLTDWVTEWQAGRSKQRKANRA